VTQRALKRLLLLIPTMLGLTLGVFMLVSLSPGGVAGGIGAAAGEAGAAPAGSRDEYLEHRFGLDKPLIVQYGHWLARLTPVRIGSPDGDPSTSSGVPLIPGVLRLDWPDLGWSFGRSRPVSALLAERLPVTLAVNVLAVGLMYAVAVPLGVFCAARHGTRVDQLINTVLTGLWSLPVACTGVLMLGYLASRQHMGWFPVAGLHDADAGEWAFLPSGANRGWALDTLWHLVLPVVCQAYVGLAVIARLVRAGVIENLGAPFVRTARAKGAPERDVVVHHAFRASLLPLITVFTAVAPAMISGSVVVERIFSLPGMGSLMIEAVTLRDRELLMGNVLLAGVVTMLAMVLGDVLYALADARTRRD